MATSGQITKEINTLYDKPHNRGRKGYGLPYRQLYNGKSLLAHRQSHRGRGAERERTGRIRERTY